MNKIIKERQNKIWCEQNHKPIEWTSILIEEEEE